MSSNSLTLAPAPRSEAAEQVREEVREFLAAELAAGSFQTHVDTWLSGVDPAFSKKLGDRGWLGMTWPRSEEHTSELQSHSDLVCRLLLEKKKKKKNNR